MALTQSEKIEHAARLVLESVEDPSFCVVYEDEELEDLSEQDQKDIHDLMIDAEITVKFPGDSEVYTK